MESAGSRRVFIKDPTDKPLQILSISQSKNDGSIYLSVPDSKCMFLDLKDLKLPSSFTADIAFDGHISFHGHGQAHIKNKNEPYSFPIRGHHLLKIKEKEISLRHLFTLASKEPGQAPGSPFASRKNDFLVTSSKQITPFIGIAFALPRVGLLIQLQITFEIDDLATIPDDFLGWALFPLIHHDIFVFFYRTKHMKRWPKYSYAQYLNGILVPIFVGQPNNSFRIDLRKPSFQLKEKELNIKL